MECGRKTLGGVDRRRSRTRSRTRFFLIHLLLLLLLLPVLHERALEPLKRALRRLRSTTEDQGHDVEALIVNSASIVIVNPFHDVVCAPQCLAWQRQLLLLGQQISGAGLQSPFSLVHRFGHVPGGRFLRHHHESVQAKNAIGIRITTIGLNRALSCSI